ncbi:MAG: dephospho-CoA kinase [Clostridiales bacterium]|nr:dephospho-CoA kinase [Clostridiales bacterium]
MKIIGLTGGIGAGKSTVSEYLKEQGLPIVDADRISRDLTADGAPLLDLLAEAFGPEILLPGKVLDRKGLARIAFASEEGKELLNRITHKAINEKILEELHALEASGTELAFLDAPLLFEAGLDQYTHQVWLVDASEEVRLARVMARDGLSEEEILDRMARQMSGEEKRARSHRILDNSGDLDALHEQIRRLLAEKDMER